MLQKSTIGRNQNQTQKLFNIKANFKTALVFIFTKHIFDTHKLVWFTKQKGQTIFLYQHHKPKKHEEFMLG
jgi:hypothetical protein